MRHSPNSDVVERIEQFDRNDSQIKWGSAIRPSPTLGAVVPVELVDERLAKMERTVGDLKKDCRSLNDKITAEKKKARAYLLAGILVGMVIWAGLGFLKGMGG